MTVVLGIDAAWTSKEPSGVALLDDVFDEGEDVTENLERQRLPSAHGRDLGARRASREKLPPLTRCQNI